VVSSLIERTIAATTRGRYLIAPPVAAGPAPLLVGFHGYAESAETQLDRLRAVPGADGWLVVSIQGLHRFYRRRTNDVIASWMTRQDRELAIADNIAYVDAVVGAVSREWGAFPRAVFAGFSQGVAMAFRAATASARPVAAVIAAGGDVPPELDAASLQRIGSTLLCRGIRDEWYSSTKFDDDVRRLRIAGVDVQPVEFDGGHTWSPEVVQAAARFLRERQP
jgi:predicted esterase